MFTSKGWRLSGSRCVLSRVRSQARGGPGRVDEWRRKEEAGSLQAGLCVAEEAGWVCASGQTQDQDRLQIKCDVCPSVWGKSPLAKPTGDEEHRRGKSDVFLLPRRDVSPSPQFWSEFGQNSGTLCMWC